MSLQKVGARWWALLLFASLAAGLQLRSGTYAADFDAHPDEAAHFVTATMVSSYLHHPWQPPMSFAWDYYNHYPKIAIGHWPPLYYLAQAPLFAVLGTTRTASLVLNVSCSIGIAWLIWWMVSLARPGIHSPGLAAGLLFLVLGPVQRAQAGVMADLFAAFWLVAATAVWMLYLDRPSLKLALGFGLLAACGYLSKGSAAPLFLVPPLTVLFTRRWELLRRRDFWASALPVLALAGPWYLFARQFNRAALGWGSSADLPAVFDVFGGALSLLGLAAAVILPKARPAVAAFLALAASYPLLSLRLGALSEDRHYLPAAAATVVLTGLLWARIQPVWLPWLTVLIYALAHGQIAQSPPAQFRNHPLPAGQNLLVSGPAEMEGSLIAAYAEREPEPHRRVMRASKLLSSSSWSGRRYASHHHTPAQVREALDENAVDRVILGRAERRHQQLLEQALHSPEWELETILPRARIYRRANLSPRK